MKSQKMKFFENLKTRFSSKLFAILCILVLAGCAQPVKESTPVPVAEPAVEPEAEPAVSVAEERVELPIETSADEPVSEPIATGPTGAQEPARLFETFFTTKEYPTSGTVHVDRTLEGNIVINFLGFDTTPGAGLHVYLYKDDIAQGVDLGGLVSVSGNYPYEVPEDVNIYQYEYIAIYSTSSGKIYGEARLS